MNDKITAITVNLNLLVNRLEWIKQQNYDDPEAVELLGDVAEWVKEISGAIGAIEKSLTPNPSPKERGVGTQFDNSLSESGVGTHPCPSPEGNIK